MLVRQTSGGRYQSEFILPAFCLGAAFQAKARQRSGKGQAEVRQRSGKGQAKVRQRSGRGQAEGRQRSGTIPKALKTVIFLIR
jgi:hypothetical protein